MKTPLPARLRIAPLVPALLAVILAAGCGRREELPLQDEVDLSLARDIFASPSEPASAIPPETVLAHAPLHLGRPREPDDRCGHHSKRDSVGRRPKDDLLRRTAPESLPHAPDRLHRRQDETEKDQPAEVLCEDAAVEHEDADQSQNGRVEDHVVQGVQPGRSRNGEETTIADRPLQGLLLAVREGSEQRLRECQRPLHAGRAGRRVA